MRLVVIALTLARFASAQDLQTWLIQGSQDLQRGDNAGAEAAFRRALELKPQSIEILNNLAIALAREGKPSEAVAIYNRALKVKPGDPVTTRNLAIAYFRAQRYKEAFPLFESLSRSAPDFQSLELAGLSLFALDRYQEAAEYLERASKLSSSDLPTLDMLGKAYLRAKNYDKVADVFARVMAVNP
ncbi:MAG: tetratricopeptide repeat protein, partial [Acidobacteriaceae bacterium]|nr:tetratricopeptide repeat protein [Acidobacteriaceae bacterium]